MDDEIIALLIEGLIQVVLSLEWDMSEYQYGCIYYNRYAHTINEILNEYDETTRYEVVYRVNKIKKSINSSILQDDHLIDRYKRKVRDS